ncbi:MAG: GtrA family protein [Oscillospiraceae bacterium]|nr:GtrA family protein [Oscillospiraceae bacterium]
MLKKLFDEKLWKFLLVGVVNTLVGMGIMFALYNLLHASYWFSSAANYVCGGLLSYFLNRNFTFKDTEKGWKPFLRFAVQMVVCYLIAYGLAKPLMWRLLAERSETLRDNAAMLTGAVLYTGLNYLGQRFFAFRKQG